MTPRSLSLHSNVKYLNPGKIYPSTFRLVRYAKMSACTYRNDPRPQKVRILGPRTSATSDLGPKFFKKIFFDFLDELSNFKHFETNFFFGLFWPFGLHKGQKASICLLTFHFAPNEQIKFFNLYSMYTTTQAIGI